MLTGIQSAGAVIQEAADGVSAEGFLFQGLIVNHGERPGMIAVTHETLRRRHLRNGIITGGNGLGNPQLQRIAAGKDAGIGLSCIGGAGNQELTARQRMDASVSRCKIVEVKGVHRTVAGLDRHGITGPGHLRILRWFRRRVRGNLGRFCGRLCRIRGWICGIRRRV